jgi:DNA-binding response OmpR family regulator
MKILVVDDDVDLLGQLKNVLLANQYIIETASDGGEALDKVFDATFDLIVLDIMMPNVDGWTVLKEMRKALIETPVVVLTAKGDVDDRVKGLDLGADDYLAKPFSTDELLARVRALLRRSSGVKTSTIKVGHIELDTVTRKVMKNGVALKLTPKEFSILDFLMHNMNRVVSRFNLAEHVWGDDFDPFSMSNFMDVHMKNLRQKLRDSDGHCIIRTVRGVGYTIDDSNNER